MENTDNIATIIDTALSADGLKNATDHELFQSHINKTICATFLMNSRARGIMSLDAWQSYLTLASTEKGRRDLSYSIIFHAANTADEMLVIDLDADNVHVTKQKDACPEMH